MDLYYKGTLQFDFMFQYFHDPDGSGNDGYREFLHGNHTLIINEGGIQNVSMPPGTKALFKGCNWKHVYDLLPTMPMTITGKFTGKIVLHTNEGSLHKIEFIPKI